MRLPAGCFSAPTLRQDNERPGPADAHDLVDVGLERLLTIGVFERPEVGFAPQKRAEARFAARNRDSHAAIVLEWGEEYNRRADGARRGRTAQTVTAGGKRKAPHPRRGYRFLDQ